MILIARRVVRLRAYERSVLEKARAAPGSLDQLRVVAVLLRTSLCRRQPGSERVRSGSPLGEDRAGARDLRRARSIHFMDFGAAALLHRTRGLDQARSRRRAEDASRLRLRGRSELAEGDHPP